MPKTETLSLKTEEAFTNSWDHKEVFPETSSVWFKKVLPRTDTLSLNTEDAFTNSWDHKEVFPDTSSV